MSFGWLVWIMRVDSGASSHAQAHPDVLGDFFQGHFYTCSLGFFSLFSADFASVYVGHSDLTEFKASMLFFWGVEKDMRHDIV